MTSTVTTERLPGALIMRHSQVKTGARTLWRLPLWSAFLGLTVLILAYPTNLRLEAFVVWSPGVFPNLPLFGTLFYLWAASLLVLLFTPKDEAKARWERLFLVAIAALVFRGFWNIIAPMQLEVVGHAAANKMWESAGHLVRHTNAPYIEWPGVSLVGMTVSQITGLGSYPVATIVSIAIIMVIAIAAYAFLLSVLKTSLSAALASLLIIIGNLAMIIYYRPGPMALAFVVLFLAVLFSKTALANASRILVALLILLAATITHLHSAMHPFFFLLGLWCFALLRKRQAEPAPTVTTLILFFVIPVAWLFYEAISGFVIIARGAGVFFSDPFSIAERLTGIFIIGQANFGEAPPLWYRETRLFWIVLLYAAGGLLWMWNLKKFRQLGPIESRLSAAFFGLMLLFGVSSLASPRGFAELLRTVTFVPLFTAPFLLLFLHRFKPPVARAALVGLAFLLVGLSFPTFMANYHGINSWVYHRTEFAPGAWLQSQYGSGQGTSIFSTTSTYRPIQLHIPDATYTAEGLNLGFASWSDWSEEVVWQAMDELVASFERSAERGDSSFFISSPKDALLQSLQFGLPYDHPLWAAMADRLSERNARVYDNGPIQVYSGPERFLGKS